MGQRTEGNEDVFDELPDATAVDWTAVQSLLRANAETTRALEAYFVRAQYREDGAADLSPAKEHIRRALDRHETIVEDLELALAAADEREETDVEPSA